MEMQYTRTAFKKRDIIIGIMPAVLLYLVLFFLPSLGTAVLSLTDYSTIPNRAWGFIGFQNYIDFLTQQNFRDTLDSIYRTIMYAFSVTFFQNGIALILAIILNIRFVKGRNLYRAAIFFPVILGVTITVVIMQIIFNPMDGPAARFIGLFGLQSNFYGDFILAFPLVIATHVWEYVGFSLVIFLAGLQTVPAQLIESAGMEGASNFKTFIKITFPLLWPTVVASVTVTLLGTLQQYQLILLSTGGQFNTMTLGMNMFINAFGGNTTGTTTGSKGQGYASAVAMVLFFIVLIFTFITQYLMKRKERDIA